MWSTLKTDAGLFCLFGWSGCATNTKFLTGAFKREALGIEIDFRYLQNPSCGRSSRS